MKNNPFYGRCKTEPVFVNSVFIDEAKELLSKSSAKKNSFIAILHREIINTIVRSPKNQLISNDTA